MILCHYEEEAGSRKKEVRRRGCPTTKDEADADEGS
jgi:hypothetical protein